MPTRSIKLKLVVPRHKNQGELAQGLWATHRVINEAVRHYEQALLDMRASEYLTAEGAIIIEEARRRALALINEARVRNCSRITAPLTDDESVSLLKDLYSKIVPSFVGNEGTAQAANAFLSPLVDSQSQGFLEIFDKLDATPSWSDGVRDGRADAFNAANSWLKSEQGLKALSPTGAPAAWIKAVRRDDRNWPVLFVQKLDQMREEVSGVPTLIRRLTAGGLLPLFEPYMSKRLSEPRGAVCPWDRLAFRLAVGHMLSWESWSRLAAKEHGARKQRLENFTARIPDDFKPEIEFLRIYEADRKEELLRLGLPAMDADFRINMRMIRGWDDVREKWRRLPRKEVGELSDVLAAEQTKKRGRFGDPHFFRWLTSPLAHHIWDRDGDVVGMTARLNAMTGVVERSRQAALMTLPDPVEHPRSAQWEAEGGSNLKNYRLVKHRHGSLEMRIPLLTGGPHFHEIEARFVAAPSDQLQSVTIPDPGKPRRIEYRNGSGEVYKGELGSADLLLDWERIRHAIVKGVHDVSGKELGPAWAKLAINIDRNIVPEWPDEKLLRAFLAHFSSAAGKNTKHEAGILIGMRVLSVDLGIRTFGFCSVFELRDQANPGLSFKISDGLFAVHERSFPVDMPGSDDRRAVRWQQKVTDDLRAMRRALSRVKAMLRLKVAELSDRTEGLESLREMLALGVVGPFEEELVETLVAAQGAPPPVWEKSVDDAVREFRTKLGLEVSKWRKANRGRGEEKWSGKSIWAIEHLTATRRFLVSWALSGGTIKRLRSAHGRFSGRLLDHIDGLKNDRLKTGADLLVQAARGYQRDASGNWVKVHKPCHAILFEDLSRYRMRTDRPRYENSQLMKWAHRAVPHETKMQADIYGIRTAETGAAFSSRYRASTMTPGIRCHPVSSDDLNDPYFREWLESENHGLDISTLKPGTILPRSGGEMFASLGRGGISLIHADVNAAQNLQRRFWLRHSEAFRVPARKVTGSGAIRWVPRQMGKRLLGALGGYGQLVPTGHDTGSCRWEPLTPAKWQKLAGEGSEPDTDEVADIDELGGFEEELLERSGDVIVYFRDPSGIVLPEDFWYPSITFWSIVKAKTSAVLLSTRKGV